MVRRDGAETRRQRIKELSKKLQGAKNLPIKKLYALVSINFGLTSEKTLEYLEVLEQLGQIEIDREMGTVSWVESEIEEGKSLKTNPG